MSFELRSCRCDPPCVRHVKMNVVKVMQFTGRLEDFWGVFIPQGEHLPITGASQMHVNMLPPELLLIIFSYCPDAVVDEIVPQVCKLWQALAGRACLRKRLTLTSRLELGTDDARNEMAGLTNLLDLRLVRRKDVATLLQQAANCNQKLRSLTIKNCDDFLDVAAGNEMLRRVIKHTQLRELTIKSSKFPMLSKPFFTSHLRMEFIRKLNFNFIPDLRQEDLVRIVRCCPVLEDFRALAWGDCAKDALLFRDQDIRLLMKLSKTLQVLKVDANNVTDVGLFLLTSCKELRKVCLRNLWRITEVGLLHFKEFSNMESLSVSQVKRVNGAAWVRLMSEPNWPDLRKLALVCCSLDNEAAQCVSLHYPNLRILNISGCNNVTITGMKHLVLNCSYLEEISLCLTQSEGCIYWIATTAPSVKKIIYHSCYSKEGAHVELNWPHKEQLKLKCPKMMNLIVFENTSPLRIHIPAVTGCRVILEHKYATMP